MKTKICAKCNNEYLATTEYFYKQLRGKYGLSSWCKHCKKEYFYNNKDKINKRRKEYRHQPEIKKRDAKRRKERYQNSGVKCRHQSNMLKSAYGITLADYDEMFKAQNGVCAICELPELMRRLSVDHDHETGKIRGLLCINCNRRLEALEDEKFVEKAKKYLTIRSYK